MTTATAPVITAAEREVILALAQGQTIEQASTAVGGSATSMKSRLARLQQRHGIHTTGAAAVALAAGLGLLDGIDLGPRQDVELTVRQREVLALLGEGLSNREIGVRLRVRETTVHTLVARIFRRIGAKTRAHAVALDWRWRYSQGGEQR